MQFYETHMGRTFFQGQLPKLIGALESIAKAMRSPAPVYQMPLEISPDFLPNLYYGAYDPSGEPGGEAQKRCTQKILVCQKNLQTMCSKNVWEQIENYRSLLDERGALEREQAFSAGFRTAMRMVAAGLSVPSDLGGENNVWHAN